MPVLLASPRIHDSPSLPFRFTGGFELHTKTIGLMLSLGGVYSMTAQMFLFPYVVKRFGTLNTFRFVLMVWPVLYFLVPYTALLPERLQTIGIAFCLLWKITAAVLAYPANAIMLTNSAPSMLVLGLINGVAASTASLSRAFGPTISGFIASWGSGHGYSGLAWWASGIICVLGAVESLWMEEGRGRMDSPLSIDEETPPSEPCIDPSAIDAAISAVATTNVDDRREE